MKALLLLTLALPASAWTWRLPWREPSEGRVRPIQVLHDQNKPHAVVAALTPEYMQRLRGTDLRQSYVLLGENLDRLGRADEAIGVYQLGVKLFPDNVDLLTRLAGVLHRTGLDTQAEPLYQKALAREPRHVGAHLGLAEIHRAQSFFDQAATHYETYLEERPADAGVWGEYAEVLLAGRDAKTADLALRRAVELAPEDPRPRVLLAFAQRAGDDLTGALERLDEALALGAGIEARRAKALWLLEAGRRPEAVKEAEAVLKSAPGDAAALWTRARARLSEGRKAEAQRDLAALEAASAKDAFAARAARALARTIR
ncbi:MAG: tetratricopeptide repeat protein [Elusimicrobiota bacterium]|nr:tetratricopeptide repeat protein [Elusimicrobiota bacterium]